MGYSLWRRHPKKKQTSRPVARQLSIAPACTKAHSHEILALSVQTGSPETPGGIFGFQYAAASWRNLTTSVIAGFLDYIAIPRAAGLEPANRASPLMARSMEGASAPTSNDVWRRRSTEVTLSSWITCQATKLLVGPSAKLASLCLGFQRWRSSWLSPLF
jgi:hypothetical protein